MSAKFARLAYIFIQIAQKPVICTHSKLWVAVAKHNLKWVQNKNAIIQRFRGLRCLILSAMLVSWWGL